MTTERKIQLLEKLIEKESSLKGLGSSNPGFKTWKNQVQRTFIRVFGEDSHELKEFNKLNFFYNPSFYFLGDDHTMQHQEYYAKDLDFALQNIKQFIADLNDELEHETSTETEESKQSISSRTNFKKVFISHSSRDKEVVEEIIDLLETIGLEPNQIFCSSFEGYGIELGQDFLQRIKEELDNEVLVLFILSENFYQSPVCLCEMGATWIKTNQHIPILIPPFDFDDVKGVIPLTQGFKINDEMKLNSFKQKIESDFSLSNSVDFTSWERKRDRILKRVNEKITKFPNKT